MVSAGVKSGIFLGCGGFLVVSGAIMVVLWPGIFMSQLQHMLILTNTSTSYDVWKETPIPMYLEFFMFNVTNIDELLLNNGAKPNLVELGPYVFREFHSKENITWNDNSTVTFYNKRTWHFDERLSNGSLSDNITTINPVVVTITHFLRFESYIVNTGVNALLRLMHEHMFITANVSSWLFDGIPDRLLSMANLTNVELPFDKFGWFYERNGSLTYDGVYVMNTGADDFAQLGNVEMWRNANKTMYADHCGDVKGSTGELWAPELGQEELFIFAPDICSYITLSKNVSETVQGIEGVKYATNRSAFDNGHNYPHMSCYCDANYPELCMPSGALNVSECKFGSPAFVSLPHFYEADPVYLDKVDGLNPTPDHNTRLTLEMFTGIPLAVAAQLQINLLVHHVRGFSILNSVNDDTMFPMFWFRQELQITDEYASMARFALNLRYGMVYGLYAGTAIGVVLLLVGVIILVRKLMSTSEPALILNENVDEQENQ